jgi:hypothetical protein
MAIEISGGRVFRTANQITFPGGRDMKEITFPAEQFTGDAMIKFEGLAAFTQFALQVDHSPAAEGATLQLARRLKKLQDDIATPFVSEDFVDNSGTVTMPSGLDQTIFDLQIRTMDELFLIVTLNGITSIAVSATLFARKPGR